MRTSLRHKLTPARRRQRVHVPALLHAHSHISPHITRVAYGLSARAPCGPMSALQTPPRPMGALCLHCRRPSPAAMTPSASRVLPVHLPSWPLHRSTTGALPSYLLRPDDPTLLTRRAAPYHSLLPLRSRLREPFASASEITPKAARPRSHPIWSSVGHIGGDYTGGAIARRPSSHVAAFKQQTSSRPRSPWWQVRSWPSAPPWASRQAPARPAWP